MVDFDASHLSEIYDLNAPRVYRYVYHRLGDGRVAEDLTSEVFVRFLRAGANPDNVTAFLYRMAHNLIVDYYRRHQPTVPLDDDIPSDSADPAHLAELEMERYWLRRALQRLTPDQQQAVVLRYLEGLSNEEIAHVIGKPVGAVKALQHRGLTTLKTLLAVHVRADWQLEMVGE